MQKTTAAATWAPIATSTASGTSATMRDRLNRLAGESIRPLLDREE